MSVDVSLTFVTIESNGTSMELPVVMNPDMTNLRFEPDEYISPEEKIKRLAGRAIFEGFTKAAHNVWVVFLVLVDGRLLIQTKVFLHPDGRVLCDGMWLVGKKKFEDFTICYPDWESFQSAIPGIKKENFRFIDIPDFVFEYLGLNK